MRYVLRAVFFSPQTSFVRVLMGDGVRLRLRFYEEAHRLLLLLTTFLAPLLNVPYVYVLIILVYALRFYFFSIFRILSSSWRNGKAGGRGDLSSHSPDGWNFSYTPFPVHPSSDPSIHPSRASSCLKWEHWPPSSSIHLLVLCLCIISLLLAGVLKKKKTGEKPVLIK